MDSLPQDDRKEKSESLEIAIHIHCSNALKFYTKSTYPEEWATTQRILGNNFVERNKGIRSENLENAIEAFNQALSVLKEGPKEEDWASGTTRTGACIPPAY